jgi:tetratricopeptide (TPR) repeat protein
LFRSRTEPKNIATATNTWQSKDKRVALGNAWNAKGLRKAQEGQREGALNCWDRALAIRKDLDPKRDLANTMNNRGIALGKLGQYQAACDSLTNALHYYHDDDGDDDDDKTKENEIIMANTLHNLANVHQQAGNLPLALQVFRNAKDACRDNLQLGRVCTAMGHAYVEAQQWKDARSSYQEALDVVAPDQAEEIHNLEKYIQKLTLLTSDQDLGKRSPGLDSPGVLVVLHEEY